MTKSKSELRYAKAPFFNFNFFLAELGFGSEQSVIYKLGLGSAESENIELDLIRTILIIVD